MSYIVMPYRVDFARLKAIRGSRDQLLLEQLRPLAQEASAYDDNDDEEWNDDGPIVGIIRRVQRIFVGKVSVEKALERFIGGKSLSGDPVRYIEAFHVIVSHIATGLDNRAVAPAAPQHFTYVDEAFNNNGIGTAVSMTSLIFGGAPVDLPSWDDFPQVGHMTPEAVEKAKGRIAAKDWSSHPQEAQRTIALVDQWIDEAAAHGEGLVCFYG